jgi:hypothetical protein
VAWWREAPERLESFLARAVQAVAALHAEAVPPQVVMATRRTDEPAGRIRLEPSLVLAAVPDTVLGPEHPPPALAVEHSKIAHRDAKRTWLQVADAAFLDQELVTDLCFSEWIDGH